MAVFVSPVRQEILACIGLHGPLTAGELARHLGRATTSLYHHLAQLVRVGAVNVTTRRRADGRPERVWTAAVGRVSLGGGPRGGAVTRAQQAAGAAALRLTTRELMHALADPEVRVGGRRREVVAMRGKAWLGAADLGALDQHIRAIEALLRRCGARRRGTRAYAVTVVLSPSARPPRSKP